MIGWFSILKTLFGLSGKIFNKFKYQKDVEQKNKIRELSYKLKKREFERIALEKADKKISNHRDYLNKS
jgi:hypothetical protein|tara:strand:- start:692 stop:898 length:207 start_codon:yes stop_codon:yes gene_type:complete